MFGEVADTYDRVRPGYPAELFDAIYALAGLAPGQSAHLCESGAGTGKASVPVGVVAARSGWSLTCVEPDPAMSRVLAHNLAAIGGLDHAIFECGLESFADGARAGEAGHGPFSLLFAAQSWHWVTPATRADHAAALLADGGTLALIWNVARPHPPELQHDLDEVYSQFMRLPNRAPDLGPDTAPMPPSSPQPIGAGLTPSAKERYTRELESSGLFGPVTLESRGWVASHDTSEWLAVLETHSDHRILPVEVREPLLERVGAVVEAHGGHVDIEYDAVAILAKRHRR